MLSLALLLPTSALLLPTGKWTVDYAPAMCTLARTFGSGAQRIDVAFRPYPDSRGLEFVLIRPDDQRKGLSRGTAKITVPGHQYSYPFVAIHPKSTTGRLIVFDADLDMIDALGDAGTLTVDAGDTVQVQLSFDHLNSATKAVDACTNDLAIQWGIPADENARIGTPAKLIGSPSEWIKVDDYPSAALGVSSGTVTIVWTIDIDGRPKDCRVIIPSGNADIDATPCRLILTRARYSAPALDRQGKPMISHATWRVTFLSNGFGG